MEARSVFQDVSAALRRRGNQSKDIGGSAKEELAILDCIQIKIMIIKIHFVPSRMAGRLSLKFHAAVHGKMKICLKIKNRIPEKHIDSLYCIR